MPRTKKTVEPETIEVETEQVDEVTHQDNQEPGVKAQREALKAAGYKRCPAHEHYLDRLPAEAQQPIAGYDDPSIRPLAEFSTNLASCRNCAKLRGADHRAEKTGTTATAVQVKRLAKLLQRHEELTRKISEYTDVERAEAQAFTAEA